MRNIKMVVEYDGTCYHGWQWQPNGITIQQVLEKTIGKITREKIKITGSGRTDAGVHAINQVANFKTTSRIEIPNLLQGVNSVLPKDIVIKELSDVDEGFHARYDAKSKVYLYRIYNNRIRSVLHRNYSWNVYEPLNVRVMEKAVVLLKGTHDFSSFCGANDDAFNHVRTVIKAEIDIEDNYMIIFTIEANGFLRHMVRNIAGTLVDVGKGKLTPEGFFEIMKCKNRTKAGITAPPQGLFLKEVKY
ncbi:MAG: tRNA pseudouridine(38-40) synthase TruA [Syntrophobacterales bacterium]|nr:tRNA pseudouridine(38-40) synthase TruA [Syntrophobacterales bacterium]